MSIPTQLPFENRFPPEQLEAFQLIAGIVEREARHLQQTQQRLITEKLDAAWVAGLETNLELAERVEAFSSRFRRLQDTLGDKLLPRMAALVGIRPAVPVELLAQAERLEWITSADTWMDWRKLRNRLVHEYITDPAEFASALNHAIRASTELIEAEQQIRRSAQRLGLLNLDPRSRTSRLESR